MRPLLPAWLWLTISLFPPGIQSLPVPPAAVSHRHSSPKSSKVPESSPALVVPTASVALGDDLTPGDRLITWRALLHKGAPPRLSRPAHKHNVAAEEGPSGQRASRGRRHANSGAGRGHGQLMRVGCVLGTCQVHNLSHRLYQLIGQSGREDSSPIHPRSPHSYG